MRTPSQSRRTTVVALAMVPDFSAIDEPSGGREASAIAELSDYRRIVIDVRP